MYYFSSVNGVLYWYELVDETDSSVMVKVHNKITDYVNILVL